MCLKYFVDVGTMAVRRGLKRDLKRIAKATGGRSHILQHVCVCTKPEMVKSREGKAVKGDED